MNKLTKDVTMWLTGELHKELTKLIMSKENYPYIYYILVVINDGYHGVPAAKNKFDSEQRVMDFSGKTVVHNRLICMNSPPSVPMVNSSLWRIDNKRGEAKCMYILPPDKPLILGTQIGEGSKLIFESARNAPLIWSTN